MRYVLICLALAGCDSLHARMLAQEGVDLYKRGKISEAAAKFDDAAKLDGNIPAIQLNLAFANVSLYQGTAKATESGAAASKAISAFEQFLKMRPDDERAKGFLVQTFVDTGRYDDAITYFKPEIEKAGAPVAKVSEMLGTLGTIAAKTGRFEDAKRWYTDRVTKDPQNPDAHVAIGVLVWDRLKTHPDITGADRIALADEALKQLEEARKLAPNSPNAFTYTNLVYRERALAATDDEGKRPDLEAANKFFLQAMELQKGVKK